MENQYFNTPYTKYIFLPSNEYNENVEKAKSIKDWCKNNRKNDTIDISDYKYEYYANYIGNWHHFTLKTQYNLIIPKINELLNFGYNKKDFNLIPYFDEDINTHEKFDLSYLYPKIDKNFTIRNENTEITGNFDILMGLNNKNGLTKYHNLYQFPHECSIIINNSENNGRTLLLSGDSQNIPEVPILAYYFKKIIYLDVRNNSNKKSYIGINYKDENITDILFSIFDKFPLNKQLYEKI